MCWIIHVLRSQVDALWLLVGSVHRIGKPAVWAVEPTIMAVFIIALGVIACWREGIGGTIVVVVGIAQSAFTWIATGHGKGLAMLISGGPFLVAGTPVVASWRRTGKQDATGADDHTAQDGHVD